MTEYCIELQDAQGTAYGCQDRFDNEMYFEDLDEARMYAKSQLDKHIVLVRIVDNHTHNVVDFFGKLV